MVTAYQGAVDVEELYRVHGRRVRWVVWRIVGNRQDADDITQSAFERLLNADTAQAPVSNEGAYVTTIAANLARNHLRQRGTVNRNAQAVAHHYASVVSPVVSLTDRIEEERREAARRAELDGAIRALPPKCRQAFVLCKLKGMTYQQAADRMGVSVHMVKKHVQRGMARLAETFDATAQHKEDTSGAAGHAD